MRRIRIQALNK